MQEYIIKHKSDSSSYEDNILKQCMLYINGYNIRKICIFIDGNIPHIALLNLSFATLDTKTKVLR